MYRCRSRAPRVPACAHAAARFRCCAPRNARCRALLPRAYTTLRALLLPCYSRHHRAAAASLHHLYLRGHAAARGVTAYARVRAHMRAGFAAFTFGSVAKTAVCCVVRAARAHARAVTARRCSARVSRARAAAYGARARTAHLRAQRRAARRVTASLWLALARARVSAAFVQQRLPPPATP